MNRIVFITTLAFVFQIILGKISDNLSDLINFNASSCNFNLNVRSRSR